MISVYCYDCNGKKSRFIREKAAIGLLSWSIIIIFVLTSAFHACIELKSPVSKVPILGDILF